MNITLAGISGRNHWAAVALGVAALAIGSARAANVEGRASADARGRTPLVAVPPHMAPRPAKGAVDRTAMSPLTHQSTHETMMPKPDMPVVGDAKAVGPHP
jgi:hypothetical protein